MRHFTLISAISAAGTARAALKMALSSLAAVASLTAAGSALAQDEVTFHKDIEPILQRSCQN